VVVVASCVASVVDSGVVSGNDVVVVASCVVSAAGAVVVDSGVVVLLRKDGIAVSSGVKEVVGAPK
jgi:hypothetical protein